MPRLKRDWIQTFTSRKFKPLEPSVESVNIRDIAHHLSCVNRFTGAARVPYSVAEHSVRVSLVTEMIVLSRGGTCAEARYLARRGLLHDGSEAYIADIATPVKDQDQMAAYRDAEEQLQRVIMRKFGLPETPDPEEVRRADAILLSTEKNELLGPSPEPWEGLLSPLEGPHDFGWPWYVAEHRFLERFCDLFGVPPAEVGL